MNPIDLEQIVDTELKRLPGPKAPRTLLPRVLAATAAQPHAAPGGGWFAWPRAWQFAGGLVAALVLIGTWRLMAFAWPFVEQLLPATGLDRAAAFTRGADDTATVVRVFWEVLLQPLATYLSVLVISFTLACALLWTAVERLAPGGAPQR
jgi:hypothetical protein